jgi:predicted unusual protein kinase regulating ubiquinone biosynthesis (AarF/ABC1/UbiB family)
MLASTPEVRVPQVRGELSTGRLLTLEWLEGTKLLEYKDRDLDTRNRIAKALFHAWWLPFARHGVIHGDPHLGNYTVFEQDGAPAGINLLDYGCIRIFPPRFVGGVVDLYRGLRENDETRVIAAYEVWGFKGLSKPMIEALNIWARFIYGPLMDDRVRTIADGVAPGQYGRREAWRVKQAMREFGPVTVPREFVFMDRAAIGLGGVFLHLKAEMNFHRLFEDAIRDFSVEKVAGRQAAALAGVGLPAAA